VRFAAQDQYLEAARELLAQAVRDRLRSEQPIAAHFSGGLDSSSVAVLASQQLRVEGQELAALYAWAPQPQPGDFPLRDERAYIETIVQHNRLPPVEYANLTLEHLAALQQVDLRQQIVMTLQNEVELLPKAQAKGIGVILSGWGGDEFIAYHANGAVASLWHQRRWQELFDRYRRGHGFLRGLKRFLKVAWFYSLPQPLSIRAELRRQRKQGLHKFDPQDPLERQINLRRVREGRPLNGTRPAQLNLLHKGHLQGRAHSWAAFGAPFGVEYRYPLLDQRLVEFALGLPWEQYFGPRAQSRYLFRLAVEPLLTPQIVWERNKYEASLIDHNRSLNQRRAAPNAPPAPYTLAWLRPSED
jgi:asparagine synthase (glutamine-hydrolysing)